METQEVTLHNELKRKSIFLRDFTTDAQMLRLDLRQGIPEGVRAGNEVRVNEISILVVGR